MWNLEASHRLGRYFPYRLGVQPGIHAPLGDLVVREGLVVRRDRVVRRGWVVRRGLVVVGRLVVLLWVVRGRRVVTGLLVVAEVDDPNSCLTIEIIVKLVIKEII